MSTVAEICAAPDDFVVRVKQMPVGDIIAMIQAWTIDDLKQLQTSGCFETVIAELPLEAIGAIQSKLQPTGVRALPGTKSHYVVASVTNMRTRSNFQLLTTGMIAFMYRALEERSRKDASNFHDLYFSTEEAAIIKSFLDEMFQYDPSRSIDRYTSELYTPKEARKKAMKGKGKEKKEGGNMGGSGGLAPQRQREAATATVKVEGVTTRKKDRLNRYSPGKSKYTEEEHTRAEISFDGASAPASPGTPASSEPITVVVDPPSNFYGRFFAFYNSHFDAIFKTTWETHLEARASEAIVDVDHQDAYIREEVQVYEDLPVYDEKGALTRDAKGAVVYNQRQIGKFTFPSPTAQWQDTIMVVAPDNGKFCRTQQEAEAEMMKHRNVTSSDLCVLPTNATVLFGSWYAGKKNIVTDDETTNAIFAKQAKDAKVYAELNKQRVEDAKFRDLIANGPDAEDFAKHMREVAPQFNLQALDEQDYEEVLERLNHFRASKQIYGNDNPDFVLYLKDRFPLRNLDQNPLTFDERKKFSRDFALANDIPAIPDESVALDFWEIGGADRDNAGVEKRREYVGGPMTMKYTGGR